MDIRSFLKRHRLLFLSIASGLLLSASWPARGVPALAFVALIPLFFVENIMFNERKVRRSAGFFLYAWLAFFVWNLLTTWWIVYATIPGMITAVVLNSFFMAIPWWLMHAFRRLLPERQGPLPVFIFWLSFEYLHAKWDLSWSWLDLGNVFASWPRWVQWYEYTGTSGGALWVLLVNLLLFMLISQLMKPEKALKRVRWFGALAAASFLIPLIISLAMHRLYHEKPDPVEVVVLQPSKDPYKPSESREESITRVEQMIGMAQALVTPETKFIVAPEAALPEGIWLHQSHLNMGLLQIRGLLAFYPELTWVTGSFTYELYPEGNNASRTARPIAGTNNYYDVYNSAVMIGQHDQFDTYHKSMLVPGIERMPFFTVLKPIGTLVSALGGTAGSMGTQAYRGVFKTGNDQPVLAPVICYESIYGDFMSEYMRRGATMIFVLTNDGWWRNTPGHRQHQEYARLRAIEFRRPVVRAASTGISSLIDQKGQVLQKTGWWEVTAIRGVVNQNRKLTYYALQGNVLGKMSLFFTALLLLVMLSRKWIKRGERQ
jgi:apolipoprotein N-acyltransferase